MLTIKQIEITKKLISCGQLISASDGFFSVFNSNNRLIFGIFPNQNKNQNPSDSFLIIQDNEARSANGLTLFCANEFHYDLNDNFISVLMFTNTVL